ncbi:MAG TPA: PepSY domain-containing protein [Steroidobacteraceae bacterium]|jgi:hypothetical protein|nr:PepSY domain-containing protein [Steroidobacteraceae bacterium]
MHKSIGLFVAPLALAFAAGALAADEPSTSSTAADSAVEALKSSLKGESGFKVDKVHVTDDGVACIKYSTAGNMGQDVHAQAVVDSGKVLRSSGRTTEFANAWNSKCAGKTAASS